MRKIRNARNALVLFAKRPQLGEVKTRLAQEIGDLFAVRFYKAFLEDTISKMIEFSLTAVKTHLFVFFPFSNDDFFQKPHLNKFNLRFQKGEDLGEKLSSAMRQLLPAYEKVVIIGADSPALPVAFIQAAFFLLDQNEIVLGPSLDGGYFLIGMTEPILEVFEDIPWSTSAVFPQTIKKVRSLNLNLGLLPPWYDIDDLDGLRFLKTHLNTGFSKNLAIAESTKNLFKKLGNVPNS